MRMVSRGPVSAAQRRSRPVDPFTDGARERIGTGSLAVFFAFECTRPVFGFERAGFDALAASDLGALVCVSATFDTAGARVVALVESLTGPAFLAPFLDGLLFACST